jgi:hypothetical protein
MVGFRRKPWTSVAREAHILSLVGRGEKANNRADLNVDFLPALLNLRVYRVP